MYRRPKWLIYVRFKQIGTRGEKLEKIWKNKKLFDDPQG
jgi:hypothetical protein